ncbi:MAG TPA: hypothetical protein VMJ33_10605 [Gallionella sp.]|nr:hypothetical protein [Gallionella sp.]
MNRPYHLLNDIRQSCSLSQAVIFLSFAVLLAAGCNAFASIIDSKHNLSASGTGSVKATSEKQVCVFCHTPHGANQSAGSPLWNHALSDATYVPYYSLSLDANPLPGPPGASSKVCLSCHDGTLAVGTVGVLNGKTNVTIAMTGTGTGGVMPEGSGATTGYTRNLGIDLSNDHPISFNYDATLGGVGGTDGELRAPPVMDGPITVVGNRTASVKKPTFPLEGNQVQCITCHDPHISTSVSPKFLRGNRLQQLQPPTGGLFMASNDIMCIACHDKAGTTWSNSAHSNQSVADETYLDIEADRREFPHATAVWQASCLNCHDSHTVQGSRRLLREGTDSLAIPKSGGNPALEQTCYQCHSPNGISVLSQIAPANDVPDIKSDFDLAIHMPIANQPETHDIGGNFDDSTSAGTGHLASGTTGRCNTSVDQCGKDFMESEALLGKASAGGIITNRHTECTDCHNPHRATKNRLFNADSATPDAAGTHKHQIVAGDSQPHDNIISGSLRGITGVEPIYPSAEFGVVPSSFAVKRGDGGTSASPLVTSTYVTREYQICLKCHSNYAYDYSPPALGYSGGTLQNTNGMLNYINDAMEFQAPINHQGAPASTTDSGAYSPAYSSNNHRSWHPVMDATGRTVALRGNISPNLWRAPWNGSDSDGGSPIVTNAVGTQTMYCSDCHGSQTNLMDGVVPFGGDNGNSWGPHGSNENFLLKGEWKTDSVPTVANDTLCFRCHEYSQYADPSGSPSPPALRSGFGGSGNDVYGVPINNLHQRHAFYTTQGGTTLPDSSISTWPVAANGQLRCTMCHTGTAHGWKNKAFLVNLNDLGPELNLITGGFGPAGALGGEISPASTSCNGNTTLCAGDNVPKGTYVPSTMLSVPAGYSNGPYYRGALLGIASTGFPASGNWAKSDCATSCH